MLVLKQRARRAGSGSVEGALFDSLPFHEDAHSAARVDNGWPEIAEAVVIGAAILVAEDVTDLGFEASRHIVASRRAGWLSDGCWSSVLPCVCER